MSLSLTAVYTLASLHAPQIAPKTILAFAHGESALDPLAVHDNFSGRGYSPKSLDAAIKLAYALMRDGHDLDLDLLSINIRNLPRLGLTVASAFNEVASIKAGRRPSSPRTRAGEPIAAGGGRLRDLLSEAIDYANSGALDTRQTQLWSENTRRHTGRAG